MNMSCGVALLIVIHEYHNVVVVLCVASGVLMRESSSEHNHAYDPCTCMRDHHLHPHSFLNTTDSCLVSSAVITLQHSLTACRRGRCAAKTMPRE